MEVVKLKKSYNVGDMAFEVAFLMKAVEEGTPFQLHIYEVVVSSLKDFCKDVLKDEFHAELQLDEHSLPVLSLNDLKKVHAFLKEASSSLSNHTRVEAEQYNIVVGFLSDVIKSVGELDAVKIQKMSYKEADIHLFRSLAEDIALMRNIEQPVDFSDKLIWVIERLTGGDSKEDAKKAIELLKKGEGEITGVGSSIENLVCSEIERNLEYF